MGVCLHHIGLAIRRVCRDESLGKIKEIANKRKVHVTPTQVQQRCELRAETDLISFII
jgi:hypothetical protein